MSLSADLSILAMMLRAGDVSPACQKATSAKLNSLADMAARMEEALNNVAGHAWDVAQREPAVVVQFPAERRVMPVLGAWE